MRLLIVEDDAVLLDGLTVGLSLCGFGSDAVATLADARLALATSRFDAIVLDIMLPDGSGLTLLNEIRQQGHKTPVLLLTARDNVADRIAGLDGGADDYLGKPFDLDELAARLRAITRRNGGRAESLLKWANISLDPAAMAVTCDGAVISLSRREFTILQALMENPRMIHSRFSLEEKLYGWQEGVESNAVEVHIHKLRSKLGSGLIRTVRGVGYQLKEE